MMECVGISCFDGEPEEELVATAPEEVLLGARGAALLRGLEGRGRLAAAAAGAALLALAASALVGRRRRPFGAARERRRRDARR